MVTRRAADHPIDGPRPDRVLSSVHRCTLKDRTAQRPQLMASPLPAFARPRPTGFRKQVVIRRIPHQMKEEDFVAALVAAATDAGMGERGGSWDLMYFTPGKMSKKRGRVSVFFLCRSIVLYDDKIARGAGCTMTSESSPINRYTNEPLPAKRSLNHFLLLYVYIFTNKQVTGTAYLHMDRGRGASADLSLINLRAAVLASDALTPAKDKDGGGKQSGDTGNTSAAAAVSAAVGPTVEAAPFQKVNKRVFVCCIFCCCCLCRCYCCF